MDTDVKIHVLRDIRVLLFAICVIMMLEKGAYIWQVCHKIWIDKYNEQVVCPDKNENGSEKYL